MRDLLGKSADSTSMQELASNYKLPYKIVASEKNPGRAALQSGSGEAYSVEEATVIIGPAIPRLHLFLLSEQIHTHYLSI